MQFRKYAMRGDCSISFGIEIWSTGTMQYSGHIENGANTLDGAPLLQDGVRVRVDLTIVDTPDTVGMPLRGTAYRYDEPFAPALAPQDWDAIQ
jgi:hypothetical protein